MMEANVLGILFFLGLFFHTVLILRFLAKCVHYNFGTLLCQVKGLQHFSRTLHGYPTIFNHTFTLWFLKANFVKGLQLFTILFILETLIYFPLIGFQSQI